MRVRFYLARKNNRRTAIVLTIRQGATAKGLKTLRIGTGLTVEASAWDSTRERLKRNHADATRVNQRLEAITAKVRELADMATRFVKTAPLQYIKEELPKTDVLDREAQAERPHPVATNVLQHFDAFINERRIFDAASTISRYGVTHNHLKKFLGSKATRFGFDGITADFYTRLIDYYFNTAELTNNTVGRHVEAFKCFLHWATEKGYNTNTEYRKLFRRADFEREATTIALTDQELRRMEKLNLSKNPRLANVRDLFVIGCLTGMRFSDVAQIKAEHVNDGFIRIHVMKTTEKLAIPVTPRLKRILRRYHPDYIFRPISSQKMNAYLKQVAALADIDDSVEIVRYRGGEKITTVCPKHEALSTHAARRTFITLSLQKKVQPEIVMKVSGHKDMRSFRKYIKHANEYIKDEMSRAWK